VKSDDSRASALPTRPFGRTGLELPVLGLGGFHLVEIPAELAAEIANRFLDAGGSYVETAAQYGNHLSEAKLGPVVEKRRGEIFLATKVWERETDAAWRQINESLETLRTDHVEVLFIHALRSKEDLDLPLGPKGKIGGTAAAVLRAQEEGLTRFIGASCHWPPYFLEAAERIPLDAILTPAGILARCNYPETEREIIPKLREKGVAIVTMKAFGDGLLSDEAAGALTYALSLPIDVAVLGINTLEQLEFALAAAREARELTADETEEIFSGSPFLGDYACRQCGECEACPTGLEIPGVFELEGKLDQQTMDYRPHPVAEYNVRRRLANWLGNVEIAKRLYEELEVKAPACIEAGHAHPCRYGIDIARKLKIAHNKLTGTNAYIV